MEKRRAYGVVLSALLIFGPLSAGIAIEKIIESKWAVAPPVIDGVEEDWAGEAFTIYKDTEVEYAVRNDAKALYILFKFNNPKYLSTVDTNGMTIYLNAQGKKSKDFGIKFLKKTVTADQLIAMLEKGGQKLTDEQKKEYKAKTQYLLFDSQVIDKKGKVVNTPGAAVEAEPAVFRPGRSRRVVIYEFRIPLAGKDATPFGIGAQPGSNIKVGFEWGGLTAEQRSRILAGAGAMQASGEGAGAIITDGEDDSGFDSSAPGLESKRRQLTRYKKFDFWADVKLAISQ